MNLHPKLVATVGVVAVLLYGAGWYVTHREQTGGSGGHLGLPPPPLGIAKYVNGSVLSTEGSVISVKYFKYGGSSPSTKMVTIDSQTEIIARKLKDMAVFYEEMAAFQKKLAAQSSPEQAPLPPLPYTESRATAEVITVGKQVQIELVSEDSAVAKKIVVLDLPPPPTP